MPTIGEFVAGYASVMGCEHGQALKLQRLLRDNDLFTTGARGVNAPSPTFLDAARMLIAHAVTSRPMLAASAVRAFGQLPCFFDTGWKPAVEWAAVAASSTMETALAAALETATGLAGDDRSVFARAARLEVTPHNLSATLSVWPGDVAFRRYDLINAVLSNHHDVVADAREQEVLAREMGAQFVELRGIEVTRSIAGDVLIALAEMITYDACASGSEAREPIR